MRRSVSLRIQDALDAMEAAGRFINGAPHAFEGDERRSVSSNTVSS